MTILPLALPEVVQAFQRLSAVARAAETNPAAGGTAWEESLQTTRDQGTIFEGPRIGALFQNWQHGQHWSDAHDDGVVSEAARGLMTGRIQMSVLSPAVFRTYLQGLNEPLPANLETIEGHHRRSPGPGLPASIVLRNPFWRSTVTRAEASLRLTATALHEAVHLVGPNDPLASELCAFAYDTALRLSYGDRDFYEMVLALGHEGENRFTSGLLAYLENAYR